jgi:nucleotide-binding universal stress UspA family protein
MNDDGTEMFRRFLIPLDGSELAERALEPASALTDAVGGELLLLSVLVPEFVVAKSGTLSIYWFAQAMTRSRQKISVHLETVQRHLAHSGHRARRIVLEGDPASTIVDTAAEEGVDLIVMSTHGRTGLRRWVYGSVTEKILSGAHCAMMIIRPLHNT